MYLLQTPVVTNNNQAMNCSDLAPARDQRPLARRTSALAAHAQALLAAPPGFWHNLVDGASRRQKLLQILDELRAAEEAFYHALADRVGLIIRRQRLERSCWDFLANAREQIKARLGREWSEQWGDLGFSDRSLRIPPDSEGRMRVLARLMEFLRAHPEMEKTSMNVTLAHGTGLSRDFSGMLVEGERVRLGLSASVGKLNRKVIELREALNSLHVDVRARLRASDPRWLFPDSGACEAKGSCEFAAPVAQSELLPVGSSKDGELLALRQRRGNAGKLSESKQEWKKVGPGGAKEQAQGLSIASATAWLLPIS